jgi:predicted phosphate transport protein (TIGR00153 family)
MTLLFKKTKLLEKKVDEYLDLVLKGAFLFRVGVKFYMEGELDELESRIHALHKCETDGDKLRRDLESDLYTETLIPESRGDVLGLLEACDRVLNMTSETLSQFFIELPYFLPELKEKYINLTDVTMDSIEQMVAAVRAYFKDIVNVRDYIRKVQLSESESDKISRKIKTVVFRADLDLCQKMHMRYFALHIEEIADEAEDVCDRLSIAAIKRSI